LSEFGKTNARRYHIERRFNSENGTKKKEEDMHKGMENQAQIKAKPISSVRARTTTNHIHRKCCNTIFERLARPKT